MRSAAGLLALGCVISTTGCVERLIRGQPSETDTDGSSSSTTEADDSSSSLPSPDSEDSEDSVDVECTQPEHCPDGATCFEGVCVGAGELRISLSWNYVSDLDLHVETPTGAYISFQTPNAGGGILDVDDCIGGDCLDNAGTHVENIYFPMQPPLGEYRVWINNFDGRDGGPFQIEISGAASATFVGEVPASPVQSQIYVFEI